MPECHGAGVGEGVVLGEAVVVGFVG